MPDMLLRGRRGENERDTFGQSPWAPTWAPATSSTEFLATGKRPPTISCIDRFRFSTAPEGCAHSRKTEAPSHRTLSWKFGLRPTVHEWLYVNSLSLAFMGMFIATFMLHALFGQWKYNEDQALRHLAEISLGS
jgi:Domain of unknown function (DUF6766)